jgi:hypothetical protein
MYLSRTSKGHKVRLDLIKGLKQLPVSLTINDATVFTGGSRTGILNYI